MSKKLVVVCLINFLIAALMGLALRFSFLGSIGVNYKFLTHAHSHVAMLGWVYLMLFTLFVRYFIPEKLKIFKRLFWLTEFVVIGMLFSFPFQGYAAVSISFSTLHIFCSYYFVYLVWKHNKVKVKSTQLLLKASLVFMLISTIGVWCLGPAVGLLGQASAFYQIAIQFFLHFQFNGWFLMAVITVFFHLLKVEDSKLLRVFFKTLVVSILFTFALPIQWFLPHNVLLWFNGFGVILQVIALFIFFKIISNKKQYLINNKFQFYLYAFALFCFALKVVFQFVSILPEFSNAVYNHRNFVIGFIHLLMLGVISGFLLSFILKKNKENTSWILYIGICSFILGFVLTEILLLIQGCNFYFKNGLLSNYYLLLFLFSILLPLGIGLVLIHFLYQKQDNTETVS